MARQTWGSNYPIPKFVPDVSKTSLGKLKGAVSVATIDGAPTFYVAFYTTVNPTRHQFKFLIDTGSAVSIIPPAALSKISVPIHKTNIRF